jgi:hypothetical protein
LDNRLIVENIQKDDRTSKNPTGITSNFPNNAIAFPNKPLKPNAIALPNKPLKTKRDRTPKATTQNQNAIALQNKPLKAKRDRTLKQTLQTKPRSPSP